MKVFTLFTETQIIFKFTFDSPDDKFIDHTEFFRQCISKMEAVHIANMDSGPANASPIPYTATVESDNNQIIFTVKKPDELARTAIFFLDEMPNAAADIAKELIRLSKKKGASAVSSATRTKAEEKDEIWGGLTPDQMQRQIEVMKNFEMMAKNASSSSSLGSSSLSTPSPQTKPPVSDAPAASGDAENDDWYDDPNAGPT